MRAPKGERKRSGRLWSKLFGNEERVFFFQRRAIKDELDFEELVLDMGQDVEKGI